MKVDKDVVDALIVGLENALWDLQKDVEFYIKKIREAETVEDIMHLKKQLLVDWLRDMPLGADECYFCELLSMICKECPYAEHHGECCSPDWEDEELYAEYKYSLREVVDKFVDLSDWRLIKGLVEVLTSVIKEKYYYGEEYEADQPNAP